MWQWLVTLIYGRPLPRVCSEAEQPAFVVDCGALPDVRVRTAEQATQYATYFCERAKAYDAAIAEPGPRSVVALKCPPGLHASVAVAVTWGLANGWLKSEEDGERAYRRLRGKDVAVLSLYRPAIRLATEMVRAKLDV
jgi:hypothetical protein